MRDVLIRQQIFLLVGDACILKAELERPRPIQPADRPRPEPLREIAEQGAGDKRRKQIVFWRQEAICF